MTVGLFIELLVNFIQQFVFVGFLYLFFDKTDNKIVNISSFAVSVLLLFSMESYFTLNEMTFNHLDSIIIVVVLLVYSYITTKTRMGRYLYAVGGNEKATKLSGINPKKVYFFAYVNMGLMSGLAGILTVARAGNAQPTFGQGYEMDAIAACFIGGASAYGGEGNIFGVVIGAILMGVINQGMSIMGMEANYQKVVKGVVLLVAIIFDVLSNKKKK